MGQSFLVNTTQTVDLMKMVRVSLETIRNLLQGGSGDADSRPQIQQLEDLEQLLIDQEARLDAIDRVLEEFNYSIAHELCAPLRRISGFTREIKQRFSDAIDPEGIQALDDILQSSQQMDDLIEALMQVSRLSHAELQLDPIDLSVIAEDIVAELKKSAPDRKADFSIQPGVTAKGDTFLVKMALRQLLDNAWKFTATRDQAVIEFGASESEGKLVYHVRDNGIGFDMKNCNTIFHPFRRLYEATGLPGSGIGLTVVKKIVERHGGQIWAEGAIDQGATFYFTL